MHAPDDEFFRSMDKAGKGHGRRKRKRNFLKALTCPKCGGRKIAIESATLEAEKKKYKFAKTPNLKVRQTVRCLEPSCGNTWNVSKYV